MSQHYADPSRASDPYSLPDVEVFFVEAGEWLYDDQGERVEPDDPSVTSDDVLTPCEAGFYWWPCFPGCLPDGEPIGPFETEEEALADAREGIE